MAFGTVMLPMPRWQTVSTTRRRGAHTHLRQHQLAEQRGEQGRLPRAYGPDNHQQLSRRDLRSGNSYCVQLRYRSCSKVERSTLIKRGSAMTGPNSACGHDRVRGQRRGDLYWEGRWKVSRRINDILFTDRGQPQLCAGTLRYKQIVMHCSVKRDPGTDTCRVMSRNAGWPPSEAAFQQKLAPFNAIAGSPASGSGIAGFCITSGSCAAPPSSSQA